MSLAEPVSRTLSLHRPSAGRAVLVTSYMTGSTSGKNLGIAGYSYDMVARLFLPLLARWGEVIPVPHPRLQLEQAAEKSRRRGLEPLHVSFLPLQDVFLPASVPNVVVPAWEYPDVPNHAFDGNPQNDWPATADRCAMLLVGGPFTVEALRRAGTKAPVRIVQVPTPEDYFAISPWDPAKRTTLPWPALVFPQPPTPEPQPITLPLRADPMAQKPPARGLKRVGKAIERVVRNAFKAVVGPKVYQRLVHPLQRSWQSAWQNLHDWEPPQARVRQFDLSGVVYTSILNPRDGRKNWQDLITGFLCALGDREDATLVIKLITSDPRAIATIVQYYVNRDIPHRCKLIFLSGYLTERQLLELAEASTYYLHTTKAEGNCLPLMNYMAAGRPGISPVHSAISDYFDRTVGLAVESHPEPCAWPHDRRLRIRTTWNRLVWPSLVAQIRASYEIAKQDRAAYDAFATRSRERMRLWASPEQVWRRLEAALDAAAAGQELRQAPFPALERKAAA